MKVRSKFGTSALALILAVGGGTAALSGSKGGEQGSSTHEIKLSRFAGTWTGPIVQAGQVPGTFKAILGPDGNGTTDLIELKCSATLKFISFDGTTLKLRYDVTADPANHCVKGGVDTASLTGPNTSTWGFIGDDGTTATGTATRVPKPRADHSCDAADQTVAKLAQHQIELDQKVSKFNEQMNVISTLRTRAIDAGKTDLVRSTNERIVKLQQNIDQKKTEISTDGADEHATEDHCGISAPPPPDQIACPDGSLHNLPFTCPGTPPPATITCPDGSLHNLPFTCPVTPPPPPSQIQCADGTIHNLPFTCPGTPPPPPNQIQCADGSIHNLPFTCPGAPPTTITCPDGSLHNLPFTCPITPPPPPDQIACADGSVHNLPFTCPGSPPPPTITCPDGSVHNLPFTCPVTPPPPPNQIQCADGLIHNLPFTCPVVPPPPTTITCFDGTTHNVPFTCPAIPPPPPNQIQCSDGSIHNLPFTCPVVPPTPTTITCQDGTTHNLPFICPAAPPPPPNQIQCADGTIHNLPFTCPPPQPATITCPDGTVHNLPFTCPSPTPPTTGTVTPFNLPSGDLTPAGIAVDGSGNIWTANQGSNSVTKFSAAGVALASFSLLPDAEAPQSMIFGGGFLWTSNLITGNVTRIDPATGTHQSFALPDGAPCGSPRPANPNQMAWDSTHGKLWIVSSTNCIGTVLRLDPTVVPAAIDRFNTCDSTSRTGILSAAGSIWESCANVLLRINPLTGLAITSIPLGVVSPLINRPISAATSLAFDGTDVWVVASDVNLTGAQDQLVRVTLTGLVRTYNFAGSQLTSVLPIAGNIWIADVNSLSSPTVIKLDPVTEVKTPFTVSGVVPGAMTSTSTDIWMTDQLASRIARFTI